MNWRWTAENSNWTVIFFLSVLTAGLHGHLTFTSILNCFLSLTALIGNVLILIFLSTWLLLTFGLCALSFKQWNPVINTRYCTIAILLPGNLGLLLLVKQYFSPPSASKSSTRPRPTTKLNKWTKHGAIQKGSFLCNMAAADAGRLLSTLCCSCGSMD